MGERIGHAPQQQNKFGSGPGPHGQATGPVRLDHKTPFTGGQVLLEFYIVGRTAFPRGFAIAVSAEVAEYFTEGTTYQQLFTTP
jgi:hypothetical protein